MKSYSVILQLIILSLVISGNLQAEKLPKLELKKDVPRICQHLRYGNWIPARNYMYSGRALLSEIPFLSSRCSGKDLMRMIVEDLSIRISKVVWSEMLKDFQSESSNPLVYSNILISVIDDADVLTRINSFNNHIKEKYKMTELGDNERAKLVKRQNLLAEMRTDIIAYLTKYPVPGSAEVLVIYSQ